MTAVAPLMALAAAGQPAAVTFTRGDAIHLEPCPWLWHEFIPADALTILGGAPGCGKTTLALSLAAVVTRGGAWPDGTRCKAPGDVLIYSGEDSPGVLAARLRAAGADMTRVHFVSGTTGTEDDYFDPARDIPLLEETAGQMEAPRLLIVDPIISAVAGDAHANNQVRRALQPLVGLAQRLRCAVVGITHFSKGTGGRDPVERITGSIGFVALARMVLIAAKHQGEEGEDERRVLMRAKCNVGPDDGGFAYSLERVEVAADVEGQRVRWLDYIEGSAREVLADAEAVEDEDTSARDDAAAFLQDMLRDGPKSYRDIMGEARPAGHAEKTIRRAKHDLRIESQKDGKGWRWALPSEGMPGKVAKTAKTAKAPSDHLLGQHDDSAPEGAFHPFNDTSASNTAIKSVTGQVGHLGHVGHLPDAEVF